MGKARSATPTAAPPAAAAADAPKKKSGSEVVQRVVFTMLMAYGFLTLVSQGAEWVMAVVLLVTAQMFYEVQRIDHDKKMDRELGYGFSLFPTYFLVIALVVTTTATLRPVIENTWPCLAGDLVVATESTGTQTGDAPAATPTKSADAASASKKVDEKKDGVCITETLKTAFLAKKIKYLDLVYMGGFMAAMLGVVAFVYSMREGYYRYQLGRFAWTVISILVIVIQGSVLHSNMTQGMFWFLLPVSCVVHNDVWAYNAGKLFGCHQLIKLSPKKTKEGFFGAWLMTMVWAFWFSSFMCRFDLLTCPKEKFLVRPECTKSDLFIHQTVQIPESISAYVLIPMYQAIAQLIEMIPKDEMGQVVINALTSVCGTAAPTVVHIAPVQWHALVIATYASLIAPFGGLFASGVKRAFGIKDFGDLIPGHGGMTDRMDCQICTGVFAAVYMKCVL